jgi:hypothetical protein
MNGIVLSVNSIGIPNVCTAPWNLQHIKELKMTEWSVETWSPIISSNKSCADVNNWLIIGMSGSDLRPVSWVFGVDGVEQDRSLSQSLGRPF